MKNTSKAVFLANDQGSLSTVLFGHAGGSGIHVRQLRADHITATDHFIGTLRE